MSFKIKSTPSKNVNPPAPSPATDAAAAPIDPHTSGPPKPLPCPPAEQTPKPFKLR